MRKFASGKDAHLRAPFCSRLGLFQALRHYFHAQLIRAQTDVDIDLLQDKRPSAPPILVFALVFWVFCAVTYWVGRSVSQIALLGIFTLSLLVTLLILALLFSRRGFAALVLCLGLFVGLAVGALGAIHTHNGELNVSNAGYKDFEFICLEDAQESSYGQRVIAQVQATDGSINLKVLAYIADEETQLFRFGECFRARAGLREVNESSASYAWQSGYVATVDIRAARIAEIGMPVKIR